MQYTFGVNAWKQWVMTKNAEIEKSSIRRKPFKSEILQLTADELNYSLCLFVKEVRKPNGSEYAPDTIYYLVLGMLFKIIHQYFLPFWSIIPHLGEKNTYFRQHITQFGEWEWESEVS